jgi:hypothetical protein
MVLSIREFISVYVISKRFYGINQVSGRVINSSGAELLSKIAIMKEKTPPDS